ncbi:MAG: response regulator transcription factor [Steroidobacteraceae bacterium]
MSISPTIVYVVDDYPRSGDGLEALFRTNGIKTQPFESGQAFLDAYPKLDPGPVFVDLSMLGMRDFQLMERLRAAHCRWPIIIVTGQGSLVSAADAMRAGAFAFLEKPLRRFEVLATASKAMEYLRNEPRYRYDEEIAQRIRRLSHRERQVFDSVLERRLNKEMAAQLGVAESTVKSTRRALMRRLQATTRVELVMMAIRGGLNLKNRS